MNKSTLTALCAVLTLVAGTLAVPGTPLAQETTHPDLSGTWQLNTAKSDDPAQVMRKAMGGDRPQGERPGGGGGMRGGGGMAGGRGGGRGGMGGGDQMGSGGGGRDSQDMAKRGEEARQRNARLEIFLEGVELNVTDGLDITRLLHTDGRQDKIWTERGEVEATARWEGPALTVRWAGPRDKTGTVRRYELSEDGATLTVTDERPLPGQDKTVKIRMVYDRQG